MKEKVGKVFSIAKDNVPLPGCTISKTIREIEPSITYFSLGGHTDISAEIFPYHKLVLVAEGELEINEPDNRTSRQLHAGEAMLTRIQTAVGMKTEKGVVYTELSIGRSDTMNETIKAGEIFTLADLVPYQKGKVVNMDVIHNDKMKFVVMAFDAGTGLAEHAAPGEALIFALDGEGIIGYEGADYPIHAGENFHFAKKGLHSVKATQPFKMALLLTLDEETERKE